MWALDCRIRIKSGLDADGGHALKRFRIYALPADATEYILTNSGVCKGGSRNASVLQESLEMLLKQPRDESGNQEVKYTKLLDFFLCGQCDGRATVFAIV
jgi:hypothetical protein